MAKNNQSGLNKQMLETHEERIKCMEHHIETTNQEMGEIQTTCATMRSDIDWLKKFQWLIFSTSLGALIIIILKTALGVV